MKGFANWIDFVAVIPYYVSAAADGDALAAFSVSDAAHAPHTARALVPPRAAHAARRAAAGFPRDPARARLPRL